MVCTCDRVKHNPWDRICHCCGSWLDNPSTSFLGRHPQRNYHPFSYDISRLGSLFEYTLALPEAGLGLYEFCGDLMIPGRDKIYFYPAQSDDAYCETPAAPGFKSALVGYLRPFLLLVGDNLRAVHAGAIRNSPQPVRDFPIKAVLTSACLSYDCPALSRAIFAADSGLYIIDNIVAAWPEAPGMMTHHLMLDLLPGEKLHQPLLVGDEAVVLSSRGRLVRFRVDLPGADLKAGVAIRDSEFPGTLTAGPGVLAADSLVFEGTQFTGPEKMKVDLYRLFLSNGGGLRLLKSMAGNLGPRSRPLASVRHLHAPIWAEDLNTIIFSSPEFDQILTTVITGDQVSKITPIDLKGIELAAHWNAACFQNGQALLPEADTGRIKGLHFDTGAFEEATLEVSLAKEPDRSSGSDVLAHPLLVIRNPDSTGEGAGSKTLIALTKRGLLSRFIQS